MARIFPIWLCSLFLALTFPASADVARDLYSASVPVADQSDASLTGAARQALEEVLIKVTGTSDVLNSAAIAPVVKEARAHVQQYAYARRGPSGEELQVRFEFDPAWVNSQVIEAGIPLWTANRPGVLLWLVLEDGQGRHFVNSETSPEKVAQVREAFKRRGVPVQLPLFDLSDSAAISPDDVWRLDETALRAASSRYGVQHIMSGRVVSLESGNFAGDWSYLALDERMDRALTVPAFDDFVGAGVALIADDMAARYAVAASAPSDRGVVVWITGVHAYADYAALVGWLQRLELVDIAMPERIVGDRLELRLQTRVSTAQLATLFELNQSLQPVDATQMGQTLSYRWEP